MPVSASRSVQKRRSKCNPRSCGPAGKVRILAVGANARLADAPTIPTIKASGLTLVADGWNALRAHASMSTANLPLIARASSAEQSAAESACLEQFCDSDPVLAAHRIEQPQAPVILEDRRITKLVGGRGHRRAP